MSLHSFARLTAACAFLLVVAGALVTSTGSGLAVPDWPLSYGRLMPRMTGGILFEHGHRMAAGTVGILTFILAGWIWRVERRRWVRATAAAAAAGIVLQAVLGGLTVLLRLPPAVSIAHACLGQTVLCLIVALAEATSPSYVSGEPSPLWRACAAAAAAAYLQLVLGAVVRHTGRGIALHIAGATAVVILLGRASASAWDSGDDRLLRPALWLALFLPLQLALGAGALIVRDRVLPWVDLWAPALPTAHLGLGAAILATAVAWTLRARRA